MESRVCRDKEETPLWWMGKVSPWLFPSVGRLPGHRGHSGFSNWFTYEWVARVSWEGRKSNVGKFVKRRPGEGNLALVDVRVLDSSSYDSSSGSVLPSRRVTRRAIVYR